MTANLLMFLGTKDFILMGRTAHVSPSADFAVLAHANCVATIMRVDVSSFGEVENTINAMRLRSQCTKGVMHAAGLQVSHIHGNNLCPPHISTGIHMSVARIASLWDPFISTRVAKLYRSTFLCARKAVGYNIWPRTRQMYLLLSNIFKRTKGIVFTIR